MKSYRIKNVKSFVDSGKVEFAPITVFVGPNSCGKSSLLRFPVVLAQSASSDGDSLLFNGRYVDYGFFENVVHNCDGGVVTYEFSYDVDLNAEEDFRYILNFDKVPREKKPKNIEEVTMRMEVCEVDNRVRVKSASMLIGGKKIVTFGRNEKNKYVSLYYVIDNQKYRRFNLSLELSSLEFKNGCFPFYNTYDMFRQLYLYAFGLSEASEKELAQAHEKFTLDDSQLEMIHLSRGEKKIKKILDTFTTVSNVMSQLFWYYRDEAAGISYIGPFREAPSRIYRDSEGTGSSSGVGVRGENVSNILARDYRKNRRLIGDISKWLEPTMGFKLAIDDLRNGFFQISLVDKKGLHSNISDVGFGVSQVLPIVTQTIKCMDRSSRKLPLENSMIFIEQPELHLHPALQAKLADLFAMCIDKAPGDNKIVIETHSEHLIRKLQVLISDKDCKLSNDMVKIYYVDKNTRGNASVKEMKLAENGKFVEEWPSGFFDQAHKLTMDLLANNAVEL